jgi:predicted nucleotidyltransferase component of viral defense system
MIMPDSPYSRQVRLLVSVLPMVGREACFALKGGTAINLFVRDMPRLSVDIDLAFLPMGDRAEALREIDAALSRISEALTGRPYGYRVRAGKHQEGRAFGLLVSDGAAEIKIEVSPVSRGTVYPEAMRRIVGSAEAEFGFAEVPVVSFADLYAGKIVAALDRQHPRDLFDVKLLLAKEGIDDELFRVSDQSRRFHRTGAESDAQTTGGFVRAPVCRDDHGPCHACRTGTGPCRADWRFAWPAGRA